MNADDKVVEEVSRVKKFIKINEFNKKILKKHFGSSDTDDSDPDPLYWEKLKDGLDCDSARELVDQVREFGDEIVEYDERINQILALLGYAEKYPDFNGYEDDAGKIFY